MRSGRRKLISGEKAAIAATAISLALLTGCSRSPNDGVVLSDPSGADRVIDFNHFDETELPPRETESESEPETEIKIIRVEPQTVSMPETQPPETQEPETQPQEVPYQKDYDFSETTVLKALIGSGTFYTRTVSQDYEKNERRSIVTPQDETSITFIADETSGSTNKTIMLDYPEGMEDKAKSDILSFDNGITEENIDSFLDGRYNEDPQLIGLAAASYTEDDEWIHIVLTKNDQEKGTVPEWDDSFASDIGSLIGSVKFSGNDLTEAIQTIEYSPVAKIKVDGDTDNVGIITQTYDQDGKLIGSSFSMEEEYKAGDHDYLVSVKDGTMKISVKRKDAYDPYFVMSFADRLYRCFLPGHLNTSYNVKAKDFESKRCIVHMTDEGFELTILQPGKTDLETARSPEKQAETELKTEKDTGSSVSYVFQSEEETEKDLASIFNGIF